MRLYLINPNNPAVSLSKTRWNRLNRYRVWKPLSLQVLAGLTPPDWEVEIIDENLGPGQYQRRPRPDLVGITAFTSQATRAYEVASIFRALGVPVVLGGIHATMCLDEALRHADAVVTGEAESVWGQVLADVKSGTLQRVYRGGLSATVDIPPARHDLLAGRYHLGSLQTTRGCPLRCNFCSVTAFNGGTFRHRPVADVIAELRRVREKKLLFVDDNLIGTRQDHIAYAKELFRAMIREGLSRPWICQATINFADDEELLDLAARSGCVGVLIGFESPTVEGLVAVHKKFNIQKGRDLRASVRRIQSHGILIVGSFIMGIDTDHKGIGAVIARAADQYGIDMASVLILTPLPGTELYADLERQGRITANRYPEDWQYYTLAYPVARYQHFTHAELV
ncbi:MAG TPA: radical SAM protein, partial [Candidatus Binatia bacterium]|nr:radical SAM protein [Candidatus Binatia bacterium]